MGGEVGAGDSIELISRDGNNVTVADITRLYLSDKDDLEVLHRAAQLKTLSKSWRDYFRKYIEKKE